MAGIYDIVIFGASGFTGKHTIAAVERICNVDGYNHTLAVAGRSKQKLQDTLRSVQNDTGLTVSKWPIILADVEDEQSLRDMAKKAKLIINCCGPYALYGEPVVKACIAEKTHHIDVTAELLFINSLHLYHNDAARKSGIYVISACGLDCIPTDMGVIFLQENFPGTLNSVELYADLLTREVDTSPELNIGTWRSMINHLENLFKCIKIEKLTRPKGIPDFKPKLKTRWIPHIHPAVEKPAFFVPSADSSVIEKTQAYLYKTEGIRPIQSRVYLVKAPWFGLFLLIVGSLIFAIMSQIKYTRDLLLKYPQFFTMGFFNANKEPSEEDMQKSNISLTMVGEGWKNKLCSPNDQYTTLPDLRIVGKIRSKSGYWLVGTCLALCAKMILTEKDKMPKEGGVYSGGAAFAKTSLIKQFKENGISVEITSMSTNK